MDAVIPRDAREGAGPMSGFARLGLLLGASLAALAASPPLGAQPSLPRDSLDAGTRARVDAVLATYTSAGAPGCAVHVRRGDRAYARGYGMASLELGVPITPETVFDLGSVGKQFTAAALWLLVQEGRVSLDDEVQRWVPELPRLGHRVTLRHLLHHTSGLRDYIDLLSAGGTQWEAVSTNRDAIDALARQRALNFAPGTAHAYSNSGYILLGEVVARATGRPVRELVRTRLLAPLGMTRSDYLDDHARVVPGKAPSYQQGPDGAWRIDASNWEQVGDGQVQASVLDLARWLAHLDAPDATPGLGGRALVDSMERTATLADGTPLTYASGLVVDRFRGQRRVRHSGGWAGYLAYAARLPEQRVAVALACNRGGFPLEALLDGVLVAVAEDALAPAAAPRMAEGARAVTRGAFPELGAAVGRWWIPVGGGVLDVAWRGDTLVAGSPDRGPLRGLVRLVDGTLMAASASGNAPRWRWDAAGGGRLVALSPNGPPLPLVRVAPPPAYDARTLAELAGRYTSPEIGGPGLVLRVHGDSLRATLGGIDRGALSPLAADVFDGALPYLRFVRDARGRATAVEMTARGLSALRLERTEPAPAGAPGMGSHDGNDPH